MSDKSIVYGRQDEQSRIPLTVRLEWYPDGTIKPCMYWMPDESCHMIRHVYECIPLVYLKERADGLRFKVKAEATGASEWLCVSEPMQSEAYLYLSDKRFCGKNIVDDRYSHESKEYIRVSLDVFPSGEYKIVYFWVSGVRYMVEKTLEIEPRASFYAGGAGVWHKVEARQVNDDDDDDLYADKSNKRVAGLYFEINKWFVRIKT
ncbi:MAG: hypothetical protein FWD05_11175 [Oscillospiraceae bacterium]|nr:hypothetical protein [Oscillospiraceae bacterium]